MANERLPERSIFIAMRGTEVFRVGRDDEPAQDGSESRRYTFVLHFLCLVDGVVRPVMGKRAGLAATSNMSWRDANMRFIILSSLERSCRSWSRPVRVLRFPSQGSHEPCPYTRGWACPKAL